MPQIRRESLAEQAADVLLHRIQAGEWDIGAKLPGETTLAPQLGIGRSSAREAIRILAGRGVLVTRQGAGVFVAATQPADHWRDVVDQADIIAVLEARAAIEVEAAALAAERRTAADLAALHEALEARDAHRQDIDDHVDTDMAFHRSIIAAAHSAVLLELFDSFAPRSRAAMIDLLRSRGHHGDRADQDVHQLLYEAVAKNDAVQAASLARTHLNQLKSGLLDLRGGRS